MVTLGRLVLVLAISSVWQAVSGYADVFSHRFVFIGFDPPLNPAHISLYVASLTGLISIYFLRGLFRSASEPVSIRISKVVLAGGALEVTAAAANELYHQLIERLYPSSVVHFAIHSFFVVSMIIIATGGFFLTLSLGKGVPTRWSGALFFSSLWLLVIGSASYLTAFAPVWAAVLLYLPVCSFLGALLLAPATFAVGKFGQATLAVSLFFAVNGALLLFLASYEAYLPYPLLAALAVDYVSLRAVRRAGPGVIGLLIGLSSYWLFYPYSFMVLDSSATPANLVPIALAAGTGILGSFVGTSIGRLMWQLATRTIVQS